MLVQMLQLRSAARNPLVLQRAHSSLQTRPQEEIGVALLHYQRPLAAVVEAAGGPDEVPSDASWRPMQVWMARVVWYRCSERSQALLCTAVHFVLTNNSLARFLLPCPQHCIHMCPCFTPGQDAVFHCFSRLSEALAEVGRTVYGDASASLNPTQNSNSSSGGVDGVSFNLRALTSTGTGPSTAAVGLAVGQQGGLVDLSAAAGSRHMDSARGAAGSLGGAGPGAMADAAAQGRAAQSADVCVLMVISNSAVIRTRVLPGVLKRYRQLLAGGVGDCNV